MVLCLFFGSKDPTWSSRPKANGRWYLFIFRTLRRAPQTKTPNANEHSCKSTEFLLSNLEMSRNVVRADKAMYKKEKETKKKKCSAFVAL